MQLSYRHVRSIYYYLKESTQRGVLHGEESSNNNEEGTAYMSTGNVVFLKLVEGQIRISRSSS